MTHVTNVVSNIFIFNSFFFIFSFFTTFLVFGNAKFDFIYSGLENYPKYTKEIFTKMLVRLDMGELKIDFKKSLGYSHFQNELKI